mgnify:CR=1 FL=1
MSIFDKLFGSAPAQQTTPPQNLPPGAQPGNQGPMQGTQATPQTAPNGVVPQQQETKPAEPPTPLDPFKDVWQTPKTEGADPNQGMFANLDPQKLMESARKVNFSGALTQENMQKIQAGGPEAIQALQESLNSVAQTVYAQSALATTKIVEQALGKQKEQYDAQLPTMVKKFSTNESLISSNPLLQNPAIQPLVGALQEQLIRKNPNATSAEIQQQVTDYFAALGNTFAPKPAAPSASQKKAAEAEDWDKFFQIS